MHSQGVTTAQKTTECNHRNTARASMLLHVLSHVWPPIASRHHQEIPKKHRTVRLNEFDMDLVKNMPKHHWERRKSFLDGWFIFSDTRSSSPTLVSRTYDFLWLLSIRLSRIATASVISVFFSYFWPKPELFASHSSFLQIWRASKHPCQLLLPADLLVPSCTRDWFFFFEKKTANPRADLSWSTAHGGCRLCFLCLIWYADLYTYSFYNPAQTETLP